MAEIITVLAVEAGAGTVVAASLAAWARRSFTPRARAAVAEARTTAE
jgi:hypothetical protein